MPFEPNIKETVFAPKQRMWESVGAKPFMRFRELKKSDEIDGPVYQVDFFKFEGDTRCFLSMVMRTANFEEAYQLVAHMWRKLQ